MSYDIFMLRLSGTGDPVARAQRAVDEQAEREELGEQPVPSAEEDDRRRRLAADLTALHPALRMSPFDRGFAYGCAIDSDDPGCFVPYIEIGIEDALVTFSYSADGRRIFPELARVVDVFACHGYVAYDPQTEAILGAPGSITHSAGTFVSSRDALIKQLEDRGEIVIGSGSERKTSSTLFRIVLIGIVLFAVLAVREYYKQPPVKLDLNLRNRIPPEIAERIKRSAQTEPGRTDEVNVPASRSHGAPPDGTSRD